LRAKPQLTQLRARLVKEQREGGITVDIELGRPLGIGFNDDLIAMEVQPDSQAYELGFSEGWRIRSISGGGTYRKLESVEDLVSKIQAFKSDGLRKATLAFAPPPVVITYDKRPFGVGIERDDTLGLIVVHEVHEPAISHGVKPGAVVAEIGGREVDTLETEEIVEVLKNIPLPTKIVFEQFQRLDRRVPEVPDAEGDEPKQERKRRRTGWG